MGLVQIPHIHKCTRKVVQIHSSSELCYFPRWALVLKKCIICLWKICKQCRILAFSSFYFSPWESEILTSYWFVVSVGSMCIREQCSTGKQHCSETVGAQDPTPTLCALEGCYLFLPGHSLILWPELARRSAAPGKGKQHIYTLARLNQSTWMGVTKASSQRGHLITRKHSGQTHPELPGEDLEKQPAHTCWCTEPCAETYWSERAVSP